MRIIALLLLFATAFNFSIVKVQAHVMQYSGTIRAVLHIRPNDEPVAGEKSELVISFKDEKNEFSLDQCNCNIIVLENNQELFSQQLTSSNTQTIQYNFPKKGVYQIKIVGTPIRENSFQPFTILFDTRVDQEVYIDDTRLNSSKGIIYVYILVGILTIPVIFLILKSKKNSKGINEKTNRNN